MGNETSVMKIPIPYPSSSNIDELFDYDRFLIQAFQTVDAMKIIGSTQIRNAAQYTNLQTALDELGTQGGGILYVPKGTYNIGNTTTLNVPANVWIIGADAVFKSQNDTTTSTAPFFSLQGDGVVFWGIQFLGSETQQGFVRPAVETNGRRVEFRFCRFIGVRSVIHRHASNNGLAVFDNCVFRNLWGDWIEADANLSIRNCSFSKTNKEVSTNILYRNRGTAIRLPLNKAIMVEINNSAFDGILRNIVWFSGATSANWLTLNLNQVQATNYGVCHFGTQAEVNAEWAVVVSEHDGLGRFVSTNDTNLFASINIVNCNVEGSSFLFLPNPSTSGTQWGTLRTINTRFLRTGLRPTSLSPLISVRVGEGLFIGCTIDDNAQGVSDFRALDLFANTSENRGRHLFEDCFLGRSVMIINQADAWSAINCRFTFGSPMPSNWAVVINPKFIGSGINTDLRGRYVIGGTQPLGGTDTMGLFVRSKESETIDNTVVSFRFRGQHNAQDFDIYGGGYVREYTAHLINLPADVFRRGANVSQQTVSWGSPALPIPAIRFPFQSSYGDADAAFVCISTEQWASLLSSQRVPIRFFIHYRVSANMNTNQIPVLRVQLYRIPSNPTSNNPVLVKQQDFALGSAINSVSGNTLRTAVFAITPSEQTDITVGMWVLVIRRVAGVNDSGFDIDVFGLEGWIPLPTPSPS